MIPTEVQARPAWSFESKTSPQGQHIEHQVIVERIRASIAVDGPRENRRKKRGASSLCQRTEHHRQPVDGRSLRRIHRVVRGQCDVDEELRGEGSRFVSRQQGRAGGRVACCIRNRSKRRIVVAALLCVVADYTKAPSYAATCWFALQ